MNSTLPPPANPHPRRGRLQIPIAGVLAGGLCWAAGLVPAPAESGCGCAPAVAGGGGADCGEHAPGPDEPVTLNLAVCIPVDGVFYYSLNGEPAQGPFEEAGLGFNTGTAPLRALNVPVGKPITLKVGDNAALQVSGEGIYSVHASFIHGAVGQPVTVAGSRIPGLEGRLTMTGESDDQPSNGQFRIVNPDGRLRRAAAAEAGAASAPPATAGSDQLDMYFRVSQTSEWQRGSSFDLNDGQGSLDETFEFMLVPSAASGAAAPGHVSEALTPASGFDDGGAYAQSEPRFYLGVGLGHDTGRAPCGMLVVDHPLSSTNAYGRAGLEFRGLNRNGEVHTNLQAGTTHLEQVAAPDVLVEIQDHAQITNAYVLHLYSAYTSTGGVFYPVGNPYKSITVAAMADPPDGYDVGIRLIIEADQTTRTIEYYADDEGENWRRVYGDGTLIEEANSLISTQDVRSVQTRLYRKSPGGGEILARESLASYELGPLGEVILESILDPAGEALTTAYTYYTTNDPGEFAYGQLESIVHPDGSWVKYEYLEPVPTYGPNYARKEYRPWMNSPASPSLAADSNCVVRTVTAYGDTLSYHARALREEDIDTKVLAVRGVVVGKERNLKKGGDLTPAPHNLTDRYEYVTSTEERKAEILFQFKPGDPQTHRADKVWAVHRMDGSKSLYGYALGDYDGQTGAFDGENCTDCDALRVEILTGYADGFTDSTPNPTNLTLVAYESTRSVRILDRADNLLREELHVFTGGTNFALMSWTSYAYDAQGRLTAVVQDGREIQSVAYNGLFETVWADESGAVTITTVNEAGEVVETIRQGLAASGAYAAQQDIATTFERVGGDVITAVSAGLLPPLSSWQSFDLAGRMSAASDAEGRITTYLYDPAARTDAVVGPGGVRTDTLRYLDGRVAAVTNNGTVAWFFAYGVEAYDLDGNGTADGDYLVSTQRLASASSPRWVRTVQDRQGRTAAVETPAFGGTETVTNRFVYDADKGRLVRELRPGHDPMLTEYDDLGHPVRVGYDRNANGTLDDGSTDRITETETLFEDWGSGDWYQVTRTYQYLTGGSGTRTCVATNATRMAALDAGIAARAVRAGVDGQTLTVETAIDRANRLRTVVTTDNASSLPATNSWRNGLLVRSSTTSVATPVSFEYDALGRRTATVDPRTGRADTTVYNDLGQVAEMRDRENHATRFGYYTNTHQNAGLLHWTENPLGAREYRAYDEQGRLRYQWGDTTYPVQYEYDAYGAMTRMYTYRGGTGWDGPNWPTATAGTADATTWAYDEPTGLLESKVDAASNAVSYAYHPSGLLHRRDWARGGLTTTFYDHDNGQLTLIAYTNSADADITYTYDRAGRLEEIADAVGERAFAYSDGGARTSVTFQAGSLFEGIAVHTPLDATGRPAGITVDDDASNIDYDLEYAYDARSRLASVALGGSTHTYTYVDNADLIERLDAATGAGTVLRRDLLYTDRDLLKLTKHTLPTGGDLIDFHHYTHDALGRRARSDIMGGMHWLYSYNDRSELIGADRKWNTTDFVFGMQYDYAYDHVGNRLSASSGGTTAGTGLHTDTYLANALNQYTTRTNAGYFHVHGQAPTGDVVTINGPTAERYAHLWHIEIAVDNSAGAVYELTEVDHLDDDIDESGFHYVPPQIETFTHDDDGNLTQDSRWTYAWNSENRLTTMTTRTGLPGNLPRIQLSFLYDHQGRRIRKTVAEWTGSAYSAVSTNHFLYNAWNLIAELNHAMVPVRTYAWGTDLSGTLQGAGGVGGLLSVDNGSTNWFTAFDGNGNLTALVDSSDGSLDAVYEYDPYGDFLRASGHAAHANPFRFSTKYQDAESGLVYYGMRYFSPALGRWLNRDPLGELGGVNLIGFLANDSINAVDLLGLSVDSPTASFWSAIASGNLRYAAALLDAMLPTLTAEQAAALTAALAAAVAAQGLIDHLDEHIGKVTDLCRRNPAPGDPGWDPLDGWLREIRAVLKNLQQKLKQMPKNKKRRKPIEEAIKRAEDALEKAKDCKACE